MTTSMFACWKCLTAYQKKYSPRSVSACETTFPSAPRHQCDACGQPCQALTICLACALENAQCQGCRTHMSTVAPALRAQIKEYREILLKSLGHHDEEYGVATGACQSELTAYLSELARIEQSLQLGETPVYIYYIKVMAAYETILKNSQATEADIQAGHNACQRAEAVMEKVYSERALQAQVERAVAMSGFSNLAQYQAAHQKWTQLTRMDQNLFAALVQFAYAESIVHGDFLGAVSCAFLFSGTSDSGSVASPAAMSSALQKVILARLTPAQVARVLNQFFS